MGAGSMPIPVRYAPRYHCPCRCITTMQTLDHLKPPYIGVGRFGANIHSWGINNTASCVCGAEEQMSQHIIYDCQALHPPPSWHRQPEDSRPSFKRIASTTFQHHMMSLLLKCKKKVQIQKNSLGGIRDSNDISCCENESGNAN